MEDVIVRLIPAKGGERKIYYKEGKAYYSLDPLSPTLEGDINVLLKEGYTVDIVGDFIPDYDKSLTVGVVIFKPLPPSLL